MTSVMPKRPPNPKARSILVCEDHDERFDVDPCEDCPSIKGNMPNVMRRAQEYEADYRERLVASHIEQEKLLGDIAASMGAVGAALKRFNQVYLAACSLIVMGLLVLLLWNAKIDAQYFYAFTFAVLSPFYGPSMGAMMREIRGPRGGANTITGWIISALAGAGAICWVFFHHVP